MNTISSKWNLDDALLTLSDKVLDFPFEHRFKVYFLINVVKKRFCKVSTVQMFFFSSDRKIVNFHVNDGVRDSGRVHVELKQLEVDR